MNSRSDIAGVEPRTSVDRAARIFGALADPTRLAIVAALEAGPACVCDLAGTVGISQSGVSHQLRVLREVGIVDCERRGRHAFYRLRDPSVVELLAVAREGGGGS